MAAFKKNYKAKKMNFKKKTTMKKTKPTKTYKKIERDIEDKEAWTSSNATFFNSGIDGSADMIQIIPNITKGVGENSRIGNQLRAKSLNIRGFIRFLPQPTNTVNTTHYGHVAIRLMVLSLKTAPNYTAAQSQASALSALLQKGGTTVGFTGAISDIFAPINSEIFTKHYNRVFYVNQSYVITGDGTTNPKVAVDVSKLVKFFNIKVKCNKILKYDASLSSDLLPSNLGCFLVAGYSYLNGDAPDYTTTNLQVSYDSVLRYEDA